MNENKPKGPGRPKKTEEISIEEVCEITLKYASNGWFLEHMPAAIYSEKGIKVSQSWLDHIKDDQYLQTKSLAKSLCHRWYTEMLLQAAVPSAAWIFLSKNVIGWRDNKDVTIQADVVTDTRTLEERKARIERIKQMAKES